VGKEREVLEHQAKAALVNRHVGNVLTFDEHLAAFGLFQSGDDAQQRRLAAAGRAKQADDLAGGHVKAHVAQQRRAAVRFVQVRNRQ